MADPGRSATVRRVVNMTALAVAEVGEGSARAGV